MKNCNGINIFQVLTVFSLSYLILNFLIVAAEVQNSPLYPRFRILSPGRFEDICVADGNPLPTYHWIITYSNGSVLTLNETVTLEDGRSLDVQNIPFFGSIISRFVISQTMASDSGNYSCVATNRLGSSIYGPTLTVFGKFNLNFFF